MTSKGKLGSRERGHNGRETKIKEGAKKKLKKNKKWKRMEVSNTKESGVKKKTKEDLKRQKKTVRSRNNEQETWRQRDLQRQ